jgi:hypothetical protein
MIDTEDLRAFIQGFFGYGSYGARYWFIGLEECGASSIKELHDRIQAWRSLGSSSVFATFARFAA